MKSLVDGFTTGMIVVLIFVVFIAPRIRSLEERITELEKKLEAQQLK